MLLDRVRIASPCSADWESMKGDEQVRFCGECGKHVYNISTMTKRDAETLLRESEGRICTRFYRRADGTILTEDCPVGLQVRAARVRRRLSFAMSGLLGFAGAAMAQTPEPQAHVDTDARATLSGVVKDQMGAPLENALVQAMDVMSGSKTETHSDAQGRYRMGLRDGEYRVTISSPGFFNPARTMVVGKKDKFILDVTMYIGQTGGPILAETPKKQRRFGWIR